MHYSIQYCEPNALQGLAIRTQRWRGKEGVDESRDQPLRKFFGERMVRPYPLHKGKKIGILPLSYGKL